eukprot:CAMPEP_0197927880 /NCGR_PEP_ID=MMETSP1439-20131203/101407_1 /TAXON_ID=66791 /ORGANISM="Gonyaulax spinifera, Strain CCMP409" /LENGTH=390 /DNA_ID=CAMNT_0043550469 /DNA_START=54 /DNA_END=1226 /DNA_ORIENTATION=-
MSVAVTQPAFAEGFKGELLAYSYFGKLVAQLAFHPSARARMGVYSFFRAFILGSCHEAATAWKCPTCERVVENAVGKGNFTGLQGKVAIVTGASNGLGLENARCLMKYGCHVIWAVRNPEKAAAALKDLRQMDGGLQGEATILKLELSDLRTIKPFVDSFLALNMPLHFLICNAGIMAPPEWTPSVQGYEAMFATNNLGHFLLTELLLPMIVETAKKAEVRIIVLSSVSGAMVSSGGLDPAKLPCPEDDYHDWAEYGVTKAVDCFYVRHLQRRLTGKNVYVCAVHPGVVGTGLGYGNKGLTNMFFGSASLAFFRRSLEKGAATTLHCALSSEIPKQVRDGEYWWYNCLPQRPQGAIARGVRDDLIDKCYDRQLELVRPFMDSPSGLVSAL